MRQILVNEQNINLKYVYFRIYMIDGVTLAYSEDYQQPEIRVNSNGWTSALIWPLENQGYGNYRALLHDEVLSTVGNIIRSHYKSDHTRDAFGEDIEIISTIQQVPIFNSEISFAQNIFNVTYANYYEAEKYFSTRLDSNAWDDAVQKDKLKSLMMATRDINRLNFFGVKLHPNQPLEFPRKHNRYPRNDHIDIILGSTVDSIRVIEDPFHNLPRDECHPTGIDLNFTRPHDGGSPYFFPPEERKRHNLIPDDIKIACCEIAIKHLEGVDMEEEMQSLIFESQRYAGIGERVNRVSTIEAYRAGINSQIAWSYIKPYLADPYQLRLVKT